MDEAADVQDGGIRWRIGLRNSIQL